MKRKKLYITGLIILGVLLLLSGCEWESKELRTILENPAANIELTTGREVERTIQDKDVVLGKPIYAEVRVVFEPIGDHTKKDIYQELIAALESDQWQQNTEGIIDRYFEVKSNQVPSLLIEIFNNPESRFVSMIITNKSL